MVGLPKVDFQVPVKVCIMCIHSRKLSRLENQTCVRNLKPICEFGEAWNQVHLQYECIIYIYIISIVLVIVVAMVLLIVIIVLIILT